MDTKLVCWARSVKSRRRAQGGQLPPLWLFTDARRLPDPLPAVARLPRGLCGVVFRHDEVAGRAALGRRLARLCRDRGIALAVAGNWRLAMALHAGLHLRAGRRPLGCPAGLALTSSAHGVADLVRARRAGVGLTFLSPLFVTASHPGARALGPLIWGLAAGRSGGNIAALGGVDSNSFRVLYQLRCAGAGAIGAFVA
jgi:thiamine-phosphate pyrophosphorylase